MKAVCMIDVCEWLNGHMCRVYCTHMRVIRTQEEIEADRRREAARRRMARAKQARREIEKFEEGDNEEIPPHMGRKL